MHQIRSGIIIVRLRRGDDKNMNEYDLIIKISSPIPLTLIERKELIIKTVREIDEYDLS